MKIKNRPERDLSEWHQWFAWHPVRIGDVTVWLEWVERRGLFAAASVVWEYELKSETKEIK